MPATALARRYLAAYHAGEEIPGGLAFAKALGQARLDYSPDSLGRIDQLLTQIRQKLRPEFGAFLAAQENQNFLYLLCFYAGEVVARYTGRSIEWYPHEELVQRLPPEAAADYPQCFATSMACVLDDSAFFVPLSSMQEILFDEGSGRSLLAAADQFMRRAVGVPVLDPAAVAPPRRPDAFPPELEAVGRFVGMAAAFAVWQVCEGQPLIPMLSQEMPSGQKLNTSLMQDDLGKAIDSGLKRLELGGEGALHAALAYDGYVNLPGFRTDALILEARAYRPDPFAFSLAVPYRHAGNPRGFALHLPRVLRLGVAESESSRLAAAFFAGMDQFQPAGLWAKHFQPEA